MTISSTTRKAGPFTGNGVQTVFAFAFKVFQASDVLVTTAASSGAAETTATLGTDYTVSLNGDQDAAPGGSITLTAPLANNAVMVISSNVDSLQSTVVTNAGGFFPAVFNAVFDKLTILVQQLAEKVGRSLTVAITSGANVSLTIPVTPSAVLQWNAAGTALTAITLPDLSLSLALPSMAGKSGFFLTNNGSVAAWSTYAPVNPTTTVSGGGLVTGGGPLSASQTLTVTAASASDVRLGTDITKALVAAALAGSAAPQTLADAATIAWDASLGYNASTTPSVAGRTIGAPTNLISGLTYSLEIIQPAGGSVTVNWNAIWDFGAAGLPTLQTTGGKADKVYAQYNARTGKLDASLRKGA